MASVSLPNFMNHDNDFFVRGNRTNALGFRISGQVTDADGVRHHVSAAFEGTVSHRGVVRVTQSGIVLRSALHRRSALRQLLDPFREPFAGPRDDGGAVVGQEVVAPARELRGGVRA